MRGKIGIIFFWLGILFTNNIIKGTSWAEEGYQSLLGRLNENLSFFNPLGNAFNHIEARIPNLFIKGLVRNRTMVDMHGRREDLFYNRSKRYNYQSIEWLAELELLYAITPKMSLVNVSDFLYDAAFDWEGGSRFGRDRYGRKSLKSWLEGEREYYRSFKEILRELYIEINYGDWFFRLGKQQVVWGKMDGKVTDIINPDINWAGPTHTQDNYRWTRIPLWMAKAVYAWKEFDFELIWTPDFEPSEGALPGDVFSTRSGYIGRYDSYRNINERVVTRFNPYKVGKRPGRALKNSQFGFRANVVKGGWDIGLMYWFPWDRFATSFRRGPLGSEYEHTRLHNFGFNLDKSFNFYRRNWVFRVESLYTKDKYIPTQGERLPLHDGVTRVNSLLNAVALETFWFRGDLTSLLQISNNRFFKYDKEDMGPLKRHQTIAILSLAYAFESFADKLVAKVGHYWVLEEGEWKGTYGISYKFSDFLEASVEYHWLSGHSDDTIFGRWGDYDQMRFQVEYNF